VTGGTSERRNEFVLAFDATANQAPDSGGPSPALSRRRSRKDREEQLGFDRPLDKLLTALRITDHEYRLAPEPPSRGELVYASCPLCRQRGYLPLAIVEKQAGREVAINCDAGCSEKDVRTTLAQELSARCLFAEAADVARWTE
jgi:hypothetical protein